jgi:hypothetical protein
MWLVLFVKFIWVLCSLVMLDHLTSVAQKYSNVMTFITNTQFKGTLNARRYIITDVTSDPCIQAWKNYDALVSLACHSFISASHPKRCIDMWRYCLSVSLKAAIKRRCVEQFFAISTIAKLGRDRQAMRMTHYQRWAVVVSTQHCPQNMSFTTLLSVVVVGVEGGGGVTSTWCMTLRNVCCVASLKLASSAECAVYCRRTRATAAHALRVHNVGPADSPGLVCQS